MSTFGPDWFHRTEPKGTSVEWGVKVKTKTQHRMSCFICSYDKKQLASFISIRFHLQAHKQLKLHICVHTFTLAAEQTTAGKVSRVFLPTSNSGTQVQPVFDGTPDSLERKLLVRFGGLSGTSLISTQMISHLLVQLTQRRNITRVGFLASLSVINDSYLPVYNQEVSDLKVPL